MESLPTVEDFTVCKPPQDDLDGYAAWKNFGALSLEAAYEKFLTSPEIYQEDFMFMGARAFRFYFPVIDRYVRAVEGPEDQFDNIAWILACGIRLQFEQDPKTLAPIRESTLELCDFVLDELENLPADHDSIPTVAETAKAWLEAWSWVMPKPERKKGEPRRRATRPWPRTVPRPTD